MKKIGPTPEPTATSTPGAHGDRHAQLRRAGQEPCPTSTPTATPVWSPTPTFTPTPTVWAYIDKIDNGDGWCDIVDATSTETVGQNHTLAVCLGNVPDTIESFWFVVSFDADLDQCVQATECAEGDDCLDSNPDANAGNTTFGQSLGDGWDCTIEGDPYCGELQANALAALDGEGSGIARIWCQRDEDNVQSGFTDYLALATVDLKVVAAGVDQVSFEDLYVWGDGYAATCEGMVVDANADTILEVVMPCQGATDIKEPVSRISIPSGAMAPGEQLSVPVKALDVPAPGLGAFTVDVSYDPNVVTPVACDANPDGALSTGFCNTDFGPDVVRCVGFQVSAGVVGDLSLCSITFEAIGASGSYSPLAPSVVEFADTLGQAISTSTENGVIVIGIRGDASGDGQVSMVDAMLIAQCVAGLIDCGGIDQTMGDVNCDGNVSMVDAMLIAQKVAGLISEFPACGP